MTEEMVLAVGAASIRTIGMVAGPLLLAAMGVGVSISVMQAITQINEATLTFIPKMIAVVVVLLVLGPWMLTVLQDYTVEVFTNAGEWVRQ
jgi:flagellar biosynthesis protein FliQ